MSETVINDTGLTKAQAAVRYALQRVVNDPNFRYVMLHTETLDRLIAADAETRDCPPWDVRNSLERAIDKAAKNQPDPDVIRESEEIRTLRARLDEAEAYCESLALEESGRSARFETAALEYLAETWEGEDAR